MGKDDEKQVEAKPAPYPRCVLFILGNEFCERFSYYGMKAILVIYLTQRLMMDDSTATSIYHAFNMVCYFTPIFGAMIADGWLGKFKTIFYISILYVIGNVVMAVTALPPPPGPEKFVGPMFGLVLIGLGTGGIKPCVSAFGGDQFGATQVKQLATFFSVFYFSINAGSLMSTLLTPILRADVKCFGTDCYPLAFGVPAGLMVVALILFLIGAKFYKINPPQGDLLGRMVRCIGSALRNRSKSEGAKKEHWLDYADEEPKFISDVRCVLKVLLLFIPLPVFWALFDQQGSRWTLQAGTMNGDITDSFRLKPDQIQALNSILVLFFIPVFESLVFPCMNKLRIPNTPLQRMNAGMFFAAIAFVIAGVLQIEIDKTAAPSVNGGEAELMFINSARCPVTIQSQFQNITLPILEKSSPVMIKSQNYTVDLSMDCGGTVTKGQGYLVLNSEGAYTAVVGNNGISPVLAQSGRERARVIRAKTHIRIVNADKEADYITIKASGGGDGFTIQNVTFLQPSPYKSIDPLKYDMNLFVKDGAESISLGSIQFRNGGVYTVVIQKDPADATKYKSSVYQDATPNEISIFWQVPQYAIMTLGEILFSVTGLSFAYSQAPPTMKSVLQAGWLLTNSFGNLLVVIIAQLRFIKSQAIEFFLFAGLMALTIVIYSIMALKYKYVEYGNEIEEETPEGTEPKPDELNGHLGNHEPVAMVYNPAEEKVGVVNRGFDFTNL